MTVIRRLWGKAMDSLVLAGLWAYRKTLARYADAELNARLEKGAATLRNVRRNR